MKQIWKIGYLFKAGNASGTDERKPPSLLLEDGREVSYRIRISPRAQSVRLKLAAREGLTVVVPAGFRLERLGGLLHSKRHWVAGHLQRFEKLQTDPPSVEQVPLARPDVLELRAIGELWRIEYREMDKQSVSARTVLPGKLVVSGPVADVALCQAVLRRWLLRHAQNTLAPWLKRLSAETGMEYSGPRFRLQRGRWGSCSSRKSISLNAKLLFLPPELARYVLLHELCHTRELNHSKRFWTLLETWEPNAKGRHAAFRAAGKFVPLWIAPESKRESEF
jgi:predicted metal-dependent hydrolase